MFSDQYLDKEENAKVQVCCKEKMEIHSAGISYLSRPI